MSISIPPGSVMSSVATKVLSATYPLRSVAPSMAMKVCPDIVVSIYLRLSVWLICWSSSGFPVERNSGLVLSTTDCSCCSVGDVELLR